MLLSRLIGLFALIPATVLLTISFFVLFSLRKLEIQGLKAFGYVLAALLWVSAILVFSSGIYTLSTGRCPMMKGCMMQDMTKHKMGMMGKGMMDMQAMPGRGGDKE
ncbi:MAG: hypothetical protein WC628_08575 [Candidatus Omnitrophota bacterium]